MAPLACLLKGLGHDVRGSDGLLYPPMSTLLDAAGIEPMVDFTPDHLVPRPDLVIVGNAVPRDNPEAVATEEQGIERISMPEALARFFLTDRKPLVVAGTHGKTTTTAMAAWIYTQCGRDPGYLVGGVPLGLPGSFAAGSGDRFVIEGDEYNAAYFDRGPKFLHYRPHTLILTSSEYDHADLYPTPEALLEAYGKLVELVPEDGLLVAYGDSADVRALAESARCRVFFYGLAEDNDLKPSGLVEHSRTGSFFVIDDPEAGQVPLRLAVTGEHNTLDALAAWAAARSDSIPAARVAAALASFRGVKRRMEELGTHRQVTVVDDFAHHPTAVAKTLAALRSRYPDRRLVVLFEPRSLTAGRSFFQEQYRDAFAAADRVLLAPIFHAKRLAENERLDLPQLGADLVERGVPTTIGKDSEELLALALDEARPGDVLVTMSSGDFAGLPQRLMTGLATGQ